MRDEHASVAALLVRTLEVLRAKNELLSVALAALHDLEVQRAHDREVYARLLDEYRDHRVYMRRLLRRKLPLSDLCVLDGLSVDAEQQNFLGTIGGAVRI